MRNRNLSPISIKAEGGLSFNPEVWFRSPVLGFLLKEKMRNESTGNRIAGKGKV